MLESGQESHVIKLIVEKAQVFFEQNLDYVEELVESLKDEQMFEAANHISKEFLEIGVRR